MICMCRCFNGPQGGAVYVDSSATFTATNCEFSSNTAVASVVMPYLDLVLFRTCVAADLIEAQRRSCVSSLGVLTSFTSFVVKDLMSHRDRESNRPGQCNNIVLCAVARRNTTSGSLLPTLR